MKINWSNWHQKQDLPPKEYICGYCGKNIGSNTGYIHSGTDSKIHICTNCGIPTFFNYGIQYPGPLLGREVQNLSPDVEKIYAEIRDSIKNNSHTGAILLGRKLIMHLAVDITKAKEGETFVAYIEHLKNSGFVPPNGEKILDYIKKLGNEKNHEIKIGSQDESQKMLKFVEALLIFMYEFPAEFPELPKAS